MRTQCPPAPRTGFTMVELLMVLAIIAILVALSTAGVVKMFEVQHRSNTQTVLNTTHGELTKQWKAVIDEATQEQIPDAVLTMASNDRDRARALWIKMRLRQEFPMTYEEAANPSQGLPAQFAALLPTRYPQILSRIAMRPGTKTPEGDSAACLLLALKKKRRGTGSNVEEALGPHVLKDTDGDELPEIVDSWGKPIVFYRWGTEHPQVETVANASAHPDRWLTKLGTSDLTTFEKWYHKVQPLKETEPTLVSAGPDDTLGLISTVGHADLFRMKPDGTGADKDNLYSFKLQ